MEIKVRVVDALEDAFVSWVFRVNENSFIDLMIENRLTDTLYSLGFVTSSSELLIKIEYLLSIWGIHWEEMTVIEAH